MKLLKILVAEDEADLRELISFQLESSGTVEVRAAPSGNSAIQILKREGDFACIISDYKMADGTGGDLFNYLLSVNSKIPFVLCSSNPPKHYPDFKGHSLHGYLVKPDIYAGLNTLVAALQMLRSGTPEVPLETVYCRIKTVTLLKLGLLYSDLYIKVGTEKYVKVFREGDTFDLFDFNRFGSKNIDFLYLPTESARKTLEIMIKNLLQLRDAKTISQDDTIGFLDSTLEVISEMNHVLGFTPEVQQLAKESAKLAAKVISKNPSLSGMISEMLVHPERYLASHSVILAHLSCGVASLLGWNSEVTFYKLTLASLLHDIVIKNQNLGRIQTQDEFLLNRGRFTDVEMTQFLMHPEICAGLIKEMSEAPPDVETIILQHHERPDGTGFPAKLHHTEISPLASVFIVAHELLLFSMDQDLKSNFPRFINELGSGFSKGHFRKILDALTQSFI